MRQAAAGNLIESGDAGWCLGWRFGDGRTLGFHFDSCMAAPASPRRSNVTAIK
jgi:hypothetical protein